jgi:hypothetical protein
MAKNSVGSGGRGRGLTPARSTGAAKGTRVVPPRHRMPAKVNPTVGNEPNSKRPSETIEES